MLSYTGTGSYLTPPGVRTLMTSLAQVLDTREWRLVTGNREGPEQAFTLGTKNKNILMYEPSEDERILNLARIHHAGFDYTDARGRADLILNATIAAKVKVVIYYDHPDSNLYYGSFRHLIRVARHLGVRCFNIGISSEQEALDEFVNTIEDDPELFDVSTEDQSP